MKKSMVALAALALATGAQAASAATILYGIEGDTNTLVRIDGTTGARTTVGATGVSAGQFGDLAYDANTGTAYWTPGRGNTNLYSLNLATGAATLIGAHGLSDAFGLAFDTANNTLYASSGNSAIYTLSTANGAATFLGNSNIYNSGLDYNALDGLVSYVGGGGFMFSLNPQTAAATFLRDGDGFLDEGDLAYDASSGSYYAVDYTGSVYQYNGEFNSRTTLSEGSPLVGLIAVADPVSAAVPEPATWMTMILGFGAVGFATRRRRTGAQIRTA